MPKVYEQLRDITTRLEKHYRDVQGFEFTIENGTLFMLQTRTGKRTAQAAVKIAVDMVKEKVITRDEAILRVEPAQLDQLLHPIIRPEGEKERNRKGPERITRRGDGQGGFHGGRRGGHGQKRERDTGQDGDLSG